MLLKLYLIALPIFLIIDLLWLGVVAKSFYREQLGSLMAPDINWTAAIIFYLIFIAGLIFFAVSPAIAKDSWSQALILGALFGFFTYATYDLTNLATIRDWPLPMTLVDLAWGTVLGGAVSFFTFIIANKFLEL